MRKAHGVELGALLGQAGSSGSAKATTDDDGNQPSAYPLRHSHFGLLEGQALLGGSPAAACELDFRTMTYGEDWSCGKGKRFRFTLPRDTAAWHGFVLWFDVTLAAGGGKAAPDVVLSTAPGVVSSWTHWGHIFWPRPQAEFASSLGGAGSTLHAGLTVSRRASRRTHDFRIDYEARPSDDVGIVEATANSGNPSTLHSLVAEDVSADDFAVEDPTVQQL